MKILLLFLPLFLLGCATTLKDSLDYVSPGMDKADVLEISGNPWLTRRANSRDMWVYRYYEGDQEYHRQLTFEDGKIIAIGPAQKHPGEKEQLIKADSMKEYENAAKKQRAGYEKGFKDVDKAADDD